MSLAKQLVERAAARLAPKAAPKRDVLLDAMREFRGAKSDEEALEAMKGFMELMDVQSEDASED